MRSMMVLIFTMVLFVPLVVVSNSYAFLQPDLKMDKPSDVALVTGPDGRLKLQYTAAVRNVGSGRFEVDGTRLDTASSMLASQRLYDNNNGGATSTVSLPNTQFVYDADQDHQHWHMQNFELGSLTDSSGHTVATLEKHGCCFWDSDRITNKWPNFYGWYGCAPSNPNALNLAMGITPGYADIYHAGIVNQWIDIQDILAGRYTLHSAVNPNLGFVQKSTTNDDAQTTVIIP